jgi:hypothetical protein
MHLKKSIVVALLVTVCSVIFLINAVIISGILSQHTCWDLGFKSLCGPFVKGYGFDRNFSLPEQNCYRVKTDVIECYSRYHIKYWFGSENGNEIEFQHDPTNSGIETAEVDKEESDIEIESNTVFTKERPENDTNSNPLSLQRTLEEPHSVSPDCPHDIATALLKNNLKPTIDIYCRTIDTFLYNEREALILEVFYTKKLHGGDMMLPVSVQVVALPSGEIVFDQDLLNLKGLLTTSAQEYLLKSVEAHEYPLSGTFVELTSEIYGLKNQYCGEFTARQPFKGNIKTCGPKAGPVTSSGNVGWDTTLPSYSESLQAALEYASEIFKSGQPEKTSNKTENPEKFVVEIAYFNEESKYWVFAVENGYINSYRFIKIDSDGVAGCIKSYGGKGSVCP